DVPRGAGLGMGAACRPRTAALQRYLWRDFLYFDRASRRARDRRSAVAVRRRRRGARGALQRAQCRGRRAGRGGLEFRLCDLAGFVRARLPDVGERFGGTVMKKLGAWVGAAVGTAIAAAPQIANACAMCGLSPGDHAGHAYNTSVLFMLSAP